MGRELQKRKNRSSRPTVRPKVLGRTKAGKKKVNFLGNETIAQNWDRSLTLEQNYKRLGLSTKLNSNISGPRKVKGKAANEIAPGKQDSLAIAQRRSQEQATIQEARIERDPETGEILRIVEELQKGINKNPLADPLNDLSEEELEEESSSKNDIIAQLEADAAQEAEFEAKRKKPRKQSSREEEWIASLIEAHGDNINAMFRDRKLNSMQQSEGDIARRVKKWKQKHG